MEIIYVAKDGTKFDSEYECESYERRLDTLYVDYPIVADDKGKIIDLKAVLTDTSKDREDIDNILNSIFYIYDGEHAEVTYENLYLLMTDYGYELPLAEDVVSNNCIALYYNEEGYYDNIGWRNYYDLENEFYRLENQFNMMF